MSDLSIQTAWNPQIGVRGLADSHARAPEGEGGFSEEALQIGREKVLQDVSEFADFVGSCESLREPSSFFGMVSTEELFRLFLSDKELTSDQLAAIRSDLRARYLDEKSDYVESLARRAMKD